MTTILGLKFRNTNKYITIFFECFKIKLYIHKLNMTWFFFQSHSTDNGFIVTHYPTPENAVDFLRLLIDHESSTVICMDPLHNIDQVSVLDIPKYVFQMIWLNCCLNIPLKKSGYYITTSIFSTFTVKFI